MQAGLVLPFRFDPARLQSDLALVRPEEWTPHYNQQDFGGEWRGAALRSPNGEITNLFAPLTPAAGFHDTDLMRRCDYFREAVSAFQCPVKSVRLLSLAPGSFIRQHSDNALVYEDGEMRIHIPVKTSAEVEFYVDGERLLFEEGRSYYVNVNLPHRITNRSALERIHLIIDVEVNDWVHELVRSARAQLAAIPRIAPPACHLAEFAARVFEDPELLDTLLSIRDRSEFIAAAVRLARERGLDVWEPDVHAAFPVFLGNGSRADHPLEFLPRDFPRGWTPIDVRFREQQPVIEWNYTGARRFTEPFFEDTVRDVRRTPFTLAFRRHTPLANLDESDSLAPSGFIFHMSRCGSTLVSQMLAALPNTLVVSEPLVLDQLLRTPEPEIGWIRRLILALGQRRTGAETHYFLKLDAWAIHRASLLRAAFPDTPCVFLFRDPLQVMLSQAKSPGAHCLPGAMSDPGVLRMRLEDITRLRRPEWAAQVLMRICESALEYRDDPGMLYVDYDDLPGAVHEQIAGHWSLPLNESDVALMRERTCFHSKDRSAWPPATEQPLDGATFETVQQLCGTLLAPQYAALKSVARRIPLVHTRGSVCS